MFDTVKPGLSSRQIRFGRVPLCIGLLALAMPSVAAVDIADKPLFVTAGVEPNIIAGIDNSGSMDSELLIPTNDGALWWRTSTESFVGLDASDQPAIGVLNYNRAGGASSDWKKFMYLFPNGTSAGERVYSDSSNDHYAIPPFPQYAFLRSPAYNGMYYDPLLVYRPWPSAGGYTFTDAMPSAARSDPTDGSATFNLTVVHRDNGSNEKFRLMEGMVVPAGAVVDYSGWTTLTVDTTRTSTNSIGVEYYPATYYELVTDASTSYEVTDDLGNVYAGNCGSREPAHYLFFERNPSKLTGIDALAYDGGCLRKVEIPASDAAAMQNFANWWTYYRKRHLGTRAGIGLAFETLGGVRVGALTNNSRSLNGMYSLSDNAERDDFFNYIYKVWGNSGGTPNRETLDYIGDQFDANNGVITEACQQNFALLFTDGFSNVSNTGAGNADGGMGVPFADGYSNTIADIAAHYYNDLLRGGAFASEKVPVPSVCNLPDPPLLADCNRDLHMVTYGVTLGAQGTLFGTAHFTTEDAHTNPPAWENPTATRNPVQVDDLYHAAVNSRGEMLNAQSAEELREVLTGALLEIVDRTRTSGTSSSTSAAILQEDTLLYSVEFRSDDWTGNLIAQEVSTVDGSLVSLAWDAESLLASRSAASRNLLTYNTDPNVDAGVELKWASLSTAQRTVLDFSVDDVSDGAGADRVDWLRGSAVSAMRNRSATGDRRLIGDIVNSTPTYVGVPNRGYSLLPADFAPEDYAAFRAGLLSARGDTDNPEARREMMMVGANDGFLHVFDGETGEELFAYMPSALLEAVDGHSHAHITLLTDPDYEHRYFVDGTPTANDVYIDGAWKTVVVGSMGVGGRSIFAIDITDPDGVGPSSVLWEFTDPDMGYGITDVQVVPMANGKFAAVFGNGYNSASDTAVLFVVDMETGALLAKIDTGAGDSSDPNGLGPAVASSWPQLDFTTQYAYAGDLHGTIWRFDLTDANPSKWTDADAVFEATDASGARQPITVQPRLSLNPKRSGELIINFGTGSFFRDQDNILTNPQVQTLYGIRESLANQTIDRGDLLEQTITAQATINALGAPRLARVVSSNTYNDQNANSEEDGWYLDLIYDGNNVGERVISNATFPSGNNRERVRFTTMTPSNDPCSSGRVGFIFDLDLFTGGATDYSVFDIDGNGVINVDDIPDLGLISAISGGRGEELTVIRNQSGTGDYFYDGTGGRIGDTSGAEGLATGDPLGRQSWQQLR